MKISSITAPSRENLLAAVKYLNHYWLRLGTAWHSTLCTQQEKSKPITMEVCRVSLKVHLIWTSICLSRYTKSFMQLCLGMVFLLCLITALVTCFLPAATVSKVYSDESAAVIRAWPNTSIKTPCFARFSLCETWFSSYHSIHWFYTILMWSVTLLKRIGGNSGFPDLKFPTEILFTILSIKQEQLAC